MGLALVQLADAAGNELVPRRILNEHLDHLRVPVRLRPALQLIKVLSSAGLVLGLKEPRLGALTSAGLVGYYAAAVGFHVRAHDHPLVAAPAALLGAAAAIAFVGVYLPVMHGAKSPRPDASR